MGTMEARKDPDMASHSTAAKKWADRLGHLLVPIVFIALVCATMPLHATYEYLTDEGYSLEKALLFTKGYALNRQIWSDQPPLMTYVLAAVIRLWGPSVYHARLVIVCLSALLLWALFRAVRLSWGTLAALASVVFLTLSTFYWNLSYWVLIGLPSLSLAMVAVYGVCHYAHRRRRYALVVSGLLLGCSMNTKFFTSFLPAILVPYLFYLEWLEKREGRAERTRYARVLWWVGGWLVSFLGIGAFAFAQYWSQLIGTHLKAESAYGDFKSFAFVCSILFCDLDLCLLGLTVPVLMLRKHGRELLIPFAWFLVAFLILLNHKPVWFRHYLLLSIPLAWLAGVGFSQCVRFDTGFLRSIDARKVKVPDLCLFLLTLGLFLTVIVFLPAKLRALTRYYDPRKARRCERIVSDLRHYAPRTHWVVTDSPIFPFYAELLVPPELAVPSQKRVLTGKISYELFVGVLEKYRPEVVLLARPGLFTTRQVMYVHRRYVLADRVGDALLYVRPDVARTP